MESSQHYDKILSGTLCKWLQPIRTSKLGSGRSAETFYFVRRQEVRCACAGIHTANHTNARGQ